MIGRLLCLRMKEPRRVGSACSLGTMPASPSALFIQRPTMLPVVLTEAGVGSASRPGQLLCNVQGPTLACLRPAYAIEWLRLAVPRVVS